MKGNEVVQTGECSNVTITTASGRVYDLGKPTDRTHLFKVWLYKKREGIKIGADGVPYRKNGGTK